MLELVVALLLLELAGVAALAAVLTGERTGRAVAAGAAVDRARWGAYRAHELAPACRGAGPTRLEAHLAPPDGGRPALATVVGCGP